LVGKEGQRQGWQKEGGSEEDQKIFRLPTKI